MFAIADVNAGAVVDSEAKRLEILTEALECFTNSGMSGQRRSRGRI